MPWYESHEEAHGVEHVMTPNIEARLLTALGNPTTCPHGNPIPGLGKLAPDEFPLDEAQAGDSLTIQRITEEAEEDARLMKYLQEHGVEPGAHMTVREAESLNATVVLEGPRGPVSLGFGVAGKLRARRV
jgi:DtxR family Mn-dependent transcriptional regulator